MWTDTYTQIERQTDDTHPSRTIVPDGIYSVGDKKLPQAVLISIIGDFGPANVREGLKWLFETLMMIIE